MTDKSGPPVPHGIERHDASDRGKWLALRKPDVTASIIGCLFAFHPYETLAGLYWQKRGLVMPDTVDESSVVIRRGRLFEDAVGRAVAEALPNWTINKANEYWRDPKLRLGATPDFYIHESRHDDHDRIVHYRRGVLQTKVVTPAAFKKSWDEVTAPFWIVLQTAVEMMLTDADFGAIGALVVGDYRLDLHVYELPRHNAAEQRIRNAVRDFWHKVEAGEEPKIDYERDGALLSILFPREQPGKILDLRSDNRLPELLDRRETLTAELKEREVEKKRLEAEIKEKLGDAESAMINGWRLSFKQQTRAAYQVAETSFRVMRATREEAR